MAYQSLMDLMNADAMQQGQMRAQAQQGQLQQLQLGQAQEDMQRKAQLRDLLPQIMGGGGNPQAMLEKLMATGNPDAIAMAGQLGSLLKTDKTAEQKNYEFGMGLPEGQRDGFFNKARTASMPASIQEWNEYVKMTPDMQARFLEMKRNPQIMNLGGSQDVRKPGGGIGESYPVTPKPDQMPDFQAAQEEAKVTARETAQQSTAAIGGFQKVKTGADNTRNMINGVLNHPGFSSTVGVTMLPGARYVPGTKEADFMSRMDQLKGSAFLQAFETLKGSGQITEVEGKKATDAINRMSINTGEEEFRQAAKDFLSVVDTAETNAFRAANKNPTKDDVTYAKQRRAEGIPDEQIAKELTDMAPTLGRDAAPKQATGTIKDPYIIQDDAGYNAVPKGKLYKAPDGSMRMKK